MGLRATLVTLCVAAQAVAAVPSRAWAQPPAAILGPSADDIERARVLDENARQLYDEGSYEGAIVAWKKAYELTEYNNLLYNISMAYDRAGDFAHALEYLDRYRALASPEERPQLLRRKKSLEARLQKQEEEAAAAAAAAASEDDDAGGPAEGTPAPQPSAGDEGSPAPTADVPRLFTPAAWALTGVSALGFGLGIGFGAASLSATRRAEDGCTDTGGDTFCSTTVEDDVAKARRNAIIADVGIAVGAVSAVAVIALVAVQARRRTQARTAAIAPAMFRGGAGLGIAARF